MSEKRKNPAGDYDGTPTGNEAVQQYDDYQIAEQRESTTKRRTIASVLLPGAENGIHLQELAFLFDCDMRTIRQAIERERREGVPILSNNRDGYYLPTGSEDIYKFCGSMRRRAHEILTTVQAVEAGTGAGD